VRCTEGLWRRKRVYRLTRTSAEGPRKELEPYSLCECQSPVCPSLDSPRPSPCVSPRPQYES